MRIVSGRLAGMCSISSLCADMFVYMCSSICVCASATPQEWSWPWASEIGGKYCARHCADALETSAMQHYLKRKTCVVTIATLAK